jgi:arylsulfatase A-like enzyme
VRSATWSRGRALAALASLLLGCDAREERPSLVLVTLDTVRADHVGAYGDARGLTPALDALARAGIVHDSAWTPMPTTGPAHLSLFTGLAPHEHGADRNGVPLDPALRPRELAARLRDHGYATAAFVTSRVLDRAATGLDGFEIYDGAGGALRPGRDAVAAALRWLAAERRRPVLLWVHLYDAHAPYGSADEKRRNLPLRPGAYGWVDGARYADPAERARMADAYAAGVRDADAALGELLAGVAKRLPSPPLIAVAADHGEALAERLEARGYAFDHGEFLDVEQTRVPLVLAGPGVTPGRSPGAVSLRDLYGTLLAAAGAIDEAEGAGWRDLREPSQGERIVTVERRGFDAVPDRHAAALRAQAAAAADGRTFVLVGEDGEPTPNGGEDPPAALVEAARSAAVRAGARAGRSGAPIDPATREALEALGYAP